MQLALLRVDFENCTSVMTVSALCVFATSDEARELVVTAAVPSGEGILMGLVFVGNGEMENNEFRWLKNEGNVVEVVRCL